MSLGRVQEKNGESPPPPLSLSFPLSFMIARRRLLCDHAKTNDSRSRKSDSRRARAATLIKDARVSEHRKTRGRVSRVLGELSKSKDFQNGMWFLSL